MPGRDKALVGGVHGEGDEAVHEGGFAFHPRADGLGGHVAAVNDGVAGEHAQRRGVARHLEVGVLEDVFVAVEAPGLLIEAGEGLYLCFDLFLDFPGEVVTRGLLRTLALAADEQHGALHMAALTQGAVGLSGDVPGGGDLQAGGPDDVRHVRPDGAGLVGEHDDLDAVVRHALGHALVGCHHAAAKILVLALDGERTAAVPDPVGELWRRVLP